MLEFKRGQKESIEKLCGSLELDIEFFHKAPMEIDCTCFGLDEAGRLSDERYFVFYNQKQSPEGAVTMANGAASGCVRFHLSLSKLPPQIAKLSFTAAIDGTRTLRELSKGYVRLLSGQTETARFSYDGAEFSGERAIVICEIYKRSGKWRFNAVGRGFNGGLKALVESFGGTVAEIVPPPVPHGLKPIATSKAAGSSPASRIASVLPENVAQRMDNLARQCRGETEYLRSIFKNMFTSLAAVPDAARRDVKVVMCADVSGSMFDMYRNGRVQRIIDKFFAFAATLSDGCQLEFWGFGAKSRQFSPVTMDNVRDYTFAEAGGFERWMSMLNYQYNNEPEAMRDVTMIHGAEKAPVFILFLTDGKLNSDWEIEEILIKTSRFPLFWQFVGIHGEEYGVLERLDQIDGRFTSNAGFFKADDIDDITDIMLFGGLLNNLSDWMDEITDKKLLERL